jgi:hypothetical protein
VIHSFTTLPSKVRFPARCIGCGASPSRSLTIEAWSGIDVFRVLRWGGLCEIEAPVCASCHARRWRRRFFWWGALALTMLLTITLIAVIAVALDMNKSPLMFMPVAVLAIVYLFHWRVREIELFQRWCLPVWLRRFKPRDGTIEICFRDEALYRDVAVLSGVLKAPAPVPTTYREPPTQTPPAWKAPPQQFPWWVAILLGLGIMGGGVAEYYQYAGYEARGTDFRDWFLLVWLYEAGGKWAVCIFFEIIGAAILALGIWKKPRGRLLP